MKVTLSDIKFIGNQQWSEWSQESNQWFGIQGRKKKQNQNRKKKKESKKTEDSVRSLWDNFKHTNIRIIGVLEGGEREQEIENLFEKIMKEKSPNLVKELDMQVQEAQRVPNKMDSKRPIPKHIIIKIPSITYKERILKEAREKQIGVHSLKKLCRQEGTGKKYSKLWKARNYSLNYSIQQSYHLESKGR